MFVWEDFLMERCGIDMVEKIYKNSFHHDFHNSVVLMYRLHGDNNNHVRAGNISVPVVYFRFCYIYQYRDSKHVWL